MSFHKVRMLAAGLAMLVIVAGTFAYGFDYYSLDAQGRVFNPKHPQLRPSGSVGAKLGMLGVGLFFALYAYPVRKRWKWLQRFGKTKNWLDFHILLGIAVPVIITLHSSFRFQGVAGVAYWLMIAVMLSGFIGRYIYGKIPKSLNETAMTLDEIEKLSASVRADLAAQKVLSSVDLERVLKTPATSRVDRMSVVRALATMLWQDLTGPFQTAALRRAAVRGDGNSVRTLFGLLPSPISEVEDAIRLARRHSRLVAKRAFLGRTNQMFQLWHVVHRPFSYSFAVLASLHIALVALMGYF